MPSRQNTVDLGWDSMPFFTKAVTRALQLYPDVNSVMDGDHKLGFDFCDISIAVSGPKGLMVPVVRNAENLTFRGVEAEIKRLALRARDGQITVNGMTGGTFTITNGGVFGSHVEYANHQPSSIWNSWNAQHYRASNCRKR